MVAPGFAPQTMGGRITVYAGADTSVGQIRLDCGQIITGQVLDTDGKPRAGAAVECQARRYIRADVALPLTPVYKLTADSEGRFVTPPLSVSFAGLSVRVAGREMPWVRVPVGADGRVEIPPMRLRPAAPIAGIVRDDAGTRWLAPGCIASISRPTPGCTSMISPPTRTAAFCSKGFQRGLSYSSTPPIGSGSTGSFNATMMGVGKWGVAGWWEWKWAVGRVGGRGRFS